MEKITFKQIGQNIIIVHDNKQMSKKFTEALDRTNIKLLVEDYNTKPSKTKLGVITKLMTVNTEIKIKEEKEVKKAVQKVKKENTIITKKVAKVKDVKLLEAEIVKLKAELKKHHAKEIPQAASGRRGEH